MEDSPKRLREERVQKRHWDTTERVTLLTCPPEETFPGRKEAHLTSPTSRTPTGNLRELGTFLLPLEKGILRELLPFFSAAKNLRRVSLSHLMAAAEHWGQKSDGSGSEHRPYRAALTSSSPPEPRASSQTQQSPLGRTFKIKPPLPASACAK